jgi:hypothetical protein
MNLCIPLTEVSPHSIYFTEKRKNIIIDGVFAKIVYSNSFVSLNGMYVCINEPTSSEIPNDRSLYGRYSILYQTSKSDLLPVENSTSHNHLPPYIYRLCQLEKDLLEHYQGFYGISKTPTYTLKNQLLTNHVSFHTPSISLPKISSSHVGVPISIVIQPPEEPLLKPIKSSHSLSSLSKFRSASKQSEEEEKRSYTSTPKNTYNCLKVSGIWENTTSIGLTYKWMYSSAFIQ